MVAREDDFRLASRRILPLGLEVGVIHHFQIVGNLLADAAERLRSIIERLAGDDDQIDAAVPSSADEIDTLQLLDGGHSGLGNPPS